MFLLKGSKLVRVPRRHSSIAVKPKCNNLSSLEIRNTFLDYFIAKHSHKFIRSSPVTPFCDPTVPFVNAGMNQFKNVFLNKATAPYKTVANSQKCIRIGGKHNDLKVIGTDGYHHTFFEMLGNWSFGDYFKERACNLAWDLLTNSYKIDPSRLYVSYFAGDEQLGIRPDLECKEIWRSIGVSENRILPFGAKDNFWEMGASGPCGTCTEIHIDHLPNSNPAHRAKLVNAGCSDLTELWNIVFIEYNRNLDGSIDPLKEKFIDTGMGFERLVAVIQGTTSNYDTDLFVPIFDAILKESKKPAYSGVYDQNDPRYELDYAYRLVADHVRMCSICIADKTYPQNNNRLRKIIRKTLKVCDETFGKNRIIQNAIVPTVIETLSSVYPELEKNSKNICEIFSHEDHLYKTSIENNRKLFKSLNISPTSDLMEEDVIDFPNFSRAYEDIDMLLKTNKSMDSLSSEYLYEKMFITFGLNEDIIQRLACEKSLKVDWHAFDLYRKMKKSEAKSKYDIDAMEFIKKLTLENIPETEYHQMYDYEFEDRSKLFVVKPLKSNVQLLVPDGNDNLYHIILNKTNFYHSAGGQDSDVGQIISSDGESVFNVENVDIHKGYVIHSGHFTDTSKPFKQNDEVNLAVDPVNRTNLSQNHTAMHLLQAAMKVTTNQIIFQQSSHISADNLKCELGSIGKRIDVVQLEKIEKFICRIIQSKLPIEIQHLNAHELYALDNLTTVPGAIYPDDGIRILRVKDERTEFESIEPCCGTHARNTKELEDFCFTTFKYNPSGWYDIIAVAGQHVHSIKVREQVFLEKYNSLKQRVDLNEHSLDEWQSMEAEANEMKSELTKDDFRYITKIRISSDMEELIKQIRMEKRNILKRLVTTELETVLEKRAHNNESFIIHVLRTAQPLDDIIMDVAINMCSDLPVILLNVCDDKIMLGCASVPLKYTHDGKFNANHWIREVADSFKIKCSSAKNRSFSSHSKMKQITNRMIEREHLENALAKARTLGKRMFDKTVSDDEHIRKVQANELMTKTDNIGVQLKRIDNLDDLLKVNRQAMEARNDIKEKLYPNATKVECLSKLEKINDQIFEIQYKIESELYLHHFETAIADSLSKQQLCIFHTIHAEHPLHHRIIRTMTDMAREYATVLIIISKNDVVGRISIPLNEQISAKCVTDEFNIQFDGKCIHYGSRLGASVCDFELKKDLVNEGKLKNIFSKVEKLIKEIYKK